MTAYIRKGVIQQIGNTLVIRIINSGGGVLPTPRQIVGGATSGLHSAPMVGDVVAVLAETGDRPLGVAGYTDRPGDLPALAGGETAIYGPDGRVLSYVKANGSTTLYEDARSVKITIDTAKHVIIDATSSGTVTINGRLALTAQTATGAGASFPSSYSGTIPIPWNGTVRDVPYL